MSNSDNNQLNIPQPCEAGSVGGQIGKNGGPGRTKKYDREIRTAMGHMQTVAYIAAIFT